MEIRIGFHFLFRLVFIEKPRRIYIRPEFQRKKWNFIYFRLLGSDNFSLINIGALKIKKVGWPGRKKI